MREGDSSLADGTFAVYLAPPEEELCGISGGLHFKHRAGFQCTRLPCELLWGPGPLEELLPTLARFEDDTLTDSVSQLDRVFVVRVDGEQTDDPRSPNDFADSSESDGVWHVLIADYPEDALWHVRRHGNQPPSEPDARCADCGVTELGRLASRSDVERCLSQYATRSRTSVPRSHPKQPTRSE